MLKANEKLTSKGCATNEKLAFLTHGWLEQLDESWVEHMIGNLTEVRGGCIIFIDYSYYSNSTLYFGLLWQFDSISKAMTKLFERVECENFSPDDWFMFGHSFGARLIIDSAANFGYQKVKEIDGIPSRFR